MTIDKINIDEAIKDAEKFLLEEKGLSSETKALMKLLVLIISLLVNRLGLNSGNSSKPPSQDPNRNKKDNTETDNKPGGQEGHTGRTLEKVSSPDETVEHKVSKCNGCNSNLKKQPAKSHETRQVFEIIIRRNVIEHRAEVKKCVKCGIKTTGEFPAEVSKAVQYGKSVKVLSVYMSQSQLIPYKRVEEFFNVQLEMPLSPGTIYNFNKEAFKKLEKFEEESKVKLLSSPLNHIDETGIRIGDGKAWLHSISNETWTFFYPHNSRGKDAINEMGVLPFYNGILCHDYYTAYFDYGGLHALCNSHHLRELERSLEQDNQCWSKLMKELLNEINGEVIKAGGRLDDLEQDKYQKRYISILRDGKKECPLNPKKEGKRGRTAQSKSRNLLDRLERHQEDVLRFMKDKIVPFTNNLAERDIRMTKVQQKISGCFRSLLGAKIFCRVRSYLSTAGKNSMTPHHALSMLFNGNIPDFQITDR